MYQCIDWLPCFEILSLSNYAYVNAVCLSYCDTTIDLYIYASLWTDKNCLELLDFILIYAKIFWGGPRPPFSIQLHQVRYYIVTQCKVIVLHIYNKTCIIPSYSCTCTYCLILRLWTFFFFLLFTFLEKKLCPPTFRHWATSLKEKSVFEG